VIAQHRQWELPLLQDQDTLEKVDFQNKREENNRIEG
jgi:hypothetical protein